MSDPAGGTTTGATTRSLVRASGGVALGTLLSRVTGLVRVGAAAYAIGTGVDRADGLADAYNRANSTPNLVYELVLGGVLTATLVPLFVDADERDDRNAVSAIFTVAMTVLAALTVVAIVLAPLLSRLLLLTSDLRNADEVRDTVTLLIRVFMPQILFYGFTALATALLNARRRFLAAAYAPVLNNVVVIAMFLALAQLADGPLTIERVRSDTSLLWLMGIGTTAGIAAMALVLVPLVARSAPRPQVLFAWRHHAVSEMIRRSGWTMGYVIANQLALIAVIMIATNEIGGISAYQMAFVFFQLPHGLLAVSLMTTFGPEFASLARRNALTQLRDRYLTGGRLLVITMLPATVIFLVLSKQVVGGLLEAGAFGEGSTALTASALRGFAVGLVPFSLYLYTLRIFYAFGDTRTPFLVNTAENAVNIALGIPMYAAFGIGGLATSYSVAYLVGALVAGRIASRRFGLAIDRRDLAPIPPAVLAALVAGAAAALTGMAAESLPALAVAVLGTVVALAVYVGVLRLTRPGDLAELTGVLRRQPRTPAPATGGGATGVEDHPEHT